MRVLSWTVWALLGAAPVPGVAAGPSGAQFERDFAALDGWVKPAEQPYRQELCLNGRWQFQPVPLPAGWKRGSGVPPELPPPAADRWESTPIKIPSPWNVNTWGAGRDVGEGTPHPFWPSSVYYPSYPPHWDGIEMGWLRRTFRVPEAWGDRRLVLHFEAVGGDAQVWVNGQKAGSHFDRYLPFELDVSDLAKRGADNELLVGVRSLRLFDQTSAKFKHMRTPYPPGSNTDNLVGIWQDVFLLGLPPVRVAEVFVKPWVDRDTLEAEVWLRNDSPREQAVEVRASVQPWVNLAGTSVLDAPEPKWRLDPPVMNLPPQRVSLKPGETRAITLSDQVAGRLRLWSPDAPNLYGLVLSLEQDRLKAGLQTEERLVLDRSYTRFGWRQCKIVGPDFLLNGRKVQMFGDLLHPFGPFVCSRRYVWAWYRMIKDMHGNAVRPHAQPHPRHYLDLADEMGLLVLDETALFGSSLQLNFESPAAWERYADHYHNLIRRDRNHPSAFGWSWGNELFAIFLYDAAITREQADAWYRQLAELGASGRPLDPTRDWFSCDGDEDLKGAMPVWSKHFGHGLPRPEWLPKEIGKPLMVGESGGTYYARPAQLAEFNGDRAYESYLGRNEALAIDVYDNVVHLAQPKLAFFSPAETAWFGLEHLNFGYRDFARLPNAMDGVWCRPFEEGKPGVQPERIPPYVCTLNPGWDPALPLYRPMPMFEAQKAAQDPRGQQPCPWDHAGGRGSGRAAEREDRLKAGLPTQDRLKAGLQTKTIEAVAFVGERDSELLKRLAALGLPLVKAEDEAAPKLLIVDVDGMTEAMIPAARRAVDATLAKRGSAGASPPQDVAARGSSAVRRTEEERHAGRVSPQDGSAGASPSQDVAARGSSAVRRTEEERHAGRVSPQDGSAGASPSRGGIVLFMVRKGAGVNRLLDRFIPTPVVLTARHATALVPRESHAWTAGMGIADLYFAEDAGGRRILQCGLDGPFVKQGRVLLEASNTDWSLFNDAPEYAKCAAVVLYERLAKPSGAALVTMGHREGTIAVSAIDCVPSSPAHVRFWRALFANMGVRLGPAAAQGGSAQPGEKPHDLLRDGPPDKKP